MKITLKKNYFSLYAKMSYNVIFSQCIAGEVFWDNSHWHWVSCGKKGTQKVKEHAIRDLLVTFEETHGVLSTS